MKTETLIKVIIFGIFFCLVILTFSATVPFYKYCPPIFPTEKRVAAERNLREFWFELVKVEHKAKKNNKGNILDKILNNKKDPWGSQYWFEVVRWETNDLSIRVIFHSSGPDKKPNTKDDLRHRYTL